MIIFTLTSLSKNLSLVSALYIKLLIWSLKAPSREKPPNFNQ